VAGVEGEAHRAVGEDEHAVHATVVLIDAPGLRVIVQIRVDDEHAAHEVHRPSEGDLQQEALVTHVAALEEEEIGSGCLGLLVSEAHVGAGGYSGEVLLDLREEAELGLDAIGDAVAVGVGRESEACYQEGYERGEYDCSHGGCPC